MRDVNWIPIGKGDERAELEKVVETLKKRWQERWHYKIEEAASDVDSGTFQLLVAHQ